MKINKFYRFEQPDSQDFDNNPQFNSQSFSNDQPSRSDNSKTNLKSQGNANFRPDATTFIPIIRFDKEQTLDGSYKTR